MKQINFFLEGESPTLKFHSLLRAVFKTSTASGIENFEKKVNGFRQLLTAMGDSISDVKRVLYPLSWKIFFLYFHKTISLSLLGLYSVIYIGKNCNKLVFLNAYFFYKKVHLFQFNSVQVSSVYFGYISFRAVKAFSSLSFPKVIIKYQQRPALLGPLSR